MRTISYTQTYIGGTTRALFVQRTYTHLAVSVLLFLAIEAALVNSAFAPVLLSKLTGGYAWLLVLGVFMMVSHVAQKFAQTTTSIPRQYLGLGLYILAEAIIFVPIIWMAKAYAPDLLGQAGVLTVALFFALSVLAFNSKRGFSFLGGALTLASFVAMGVIVASILFGFTLGSIFSAFMIVFASGAILYSTSEVVRTYPENMHVAAALSLFASVALLFWYILQFLISATNGD